MPGPAVLILLPPSEGKTAASSRRHPVDLEALSYPELTDARRTVGDALARTSAGADALRILGVGASVEPQVRAAVDLWSLPAAPAGEIYSGVLFDALHLSGMSAAGRRRANRSLLVISALWGAVRVTDRIPAYRLSMTVDLPGVGPLARFWQPHLTAVLTPAASGLVVDCRSAAYQQAWRSDPDRTVQIRVVAPDSRAAVSHMAKHTRGLVTRHLCIRPGRAPATPTALAAAVGESFEVGLTRPRPTGPWTLDVVEPA